MRIALFAVSGILLVPAWAVAKWEEREAALTKLSFAYHVERSIDDGTGPRQTVEVGRLAYTSPVRYQWRQAVEEGGKDFADRETFRDGDLRLVIDHRNAKATVLETELPDEQLQDPWVNLGPKPCLPIAGGLSRATSWMETSGKWRADQKNRASSLELALNADGLPETILRRFPRGQEVSWTYKGWLRDGATAIPLETRSVTGGTAVLKVDARYSFSQLDASPKMVALDEAGWWNAEFILTDERVSPVVGYAKGEVARLYQEGKIRSLEDLLVESRRRSQRLQLGEEKALARQKVMQGRTRSGLFPFVGVGMAILGFGLIILAKRLRAQHL